MDTWWSSASGTDESVRAILGTEDFGTTLEMHGFTSVSEPLLEMKRGCSMPLLAGVHGSVSSPTSGFEKRLSNMFSMEEHCGIVPEIFPSRVASRENHLQRQSSMLDSLKSSGGGVWGDQGSPHKSPSSPTQAARRERKRISNRESARRMRQLRQHQLTTLHLKIKELEDSNRKLAEQAQKHRNLLVRTVPSLITKCKDLMEEKDKLVQANKIMQAALKSHSPIFLPRN